MKKRLVSLLVALALVVCAIPTSSVAKAYPRLSKTSVSILTGNATTIQMKNTKKKVTWSSSNKKIATVSKGKITGINVGSCYITATVSKLKYSCYVNVQFNSAAAEKKITTTYMQCGKYIIAKYTNNNKFPISVSPKMVFYNAANNLLDYSSDSNMCLQPGKTCVLSFFKPNFGAGTYHHYKVMINSDKSYNTGHVENISVTSNIGTKSVMAEFKNNGKVKLTFVKVSIIYYDAAHKAIGHDWTYADCNAIGSSDIVSFYLPKDSNYDYIFPTTYEITVNSAY